MSRVAVGLLFSFAALAAAQTPRARDGAGVRIVDNPSRLKAPTAFRLGDKPVFDAGGLEGDPDVEISSRQGYPLAIRLANGNVAITDRARVQTFSAAGKRLRISGREGRGPGEFTAVTHLCRARGDTVLASDGKRPVK